MSTNNCPNCGPYDCYRICPNHPEYYSAEQEMQDDATYYDRNEYYREAGYDDPDLYADRDDEEAELDLAEPSPLFEVVGAFVYDGRTNSMTPIDPDDIPF